METFLLIAEESLEKLDPFVASLQARIRRTDEEILAAVKRQSSSGNRARSELRSAQSFVIEALNQINDIRRRAAQTESMVKDVCKNIKQLDYAKRNLTATITAMRRLAMLISAVDRLQRASERREFDEAAHLLGAVQQLASHFAGLSQVPRVAEIRGRVAALEQALKSASLREFELLSEDVPDPSLLKRLSDCAALIDALGASARDELVDKFCKKEIETYTQIFGSTGDTSKLDRVVNRYKWLIRRLETRKDVFEIFPKDWRVAQLLCVTFCSVTKTVLAEILDERSSELQYHLDSLLHAVEATNIFEAEIAKRFSRSTGNKLDLANRSDSYALGSKDVPDEADMFSSTKDDALSASEIRIRYEKEFSKRNSESKHATDREKAQHRAAAEAVARASFVGSISTVFIPYLHVYVEHVLNNLQNAVQSAVANETWLPISPDQFVLKSANDLTDAVRVEMKDCIARIDRGVILRDLTKAFSNSYRIYCQLLDEKLPKNSVGSTSGTPTLGVLEWQIKITNKDFEVVSLILSTAEHCIDMLDQLSRAIAARLEPKSLGRDLSFDDEQERFRSLAVNCMSVMLLGLDTRLEVPLGMLVKTNWSTWEMVGDQTSWAIEAERTLREVGPVLGKSLASNHFRFFCDKLSRSFADRLLAAVYYCSGMSDAACQQLRLDIEAVKIALITMAKAGASNSPDSTVLEWVPLFSSSVSSQMAKVEAVLKVVSSPVESLVDTFLQLLPNSAPSELRKIAEVKGLKRGQLAAVLDAYSNRSNNDKRADEIKNMILTDTLETSPSPPVDSGLLSHFRSHSSKNSANASDMSSMFRLSSSSAAQARAGASAAAENMRETMGQALKSMKGLKFMQKRGSSRGHSFAP